MPCGPIRLVFPSFSTSLVWWAASNSPQREIGCTGKLFPASVDDHWGHRHTNLLANSRVIQAFRRLAAARGAPMETRYKNYRIEAYQTEIRRWRARIRRLDGKKVKVAATGEQHEFLPTAAARGAMTARTAIDVAKALIDDGTID